MNNIKTLDELKKAVEAADAEWERRISAVAYNGCTIPLREMAPINRPYFAARAALRRAEEKIKLEDSLNGNALDRENEMNNSNDKIDTCTACGGSRDDNGWSVCSDCVYGTQAEQAEDAANEASHEERWRYMKALQGFLDKNPCMSEMDYREAMGLYAYPVQDENEIMDDPFAEAVI